MNYSFAYSRKSRSLEYVTCTAFRSIRPDRQGRGIGYRRCDRYGVELPFDVPPENCLAVELVPDGIKGVKGLVRYPAGFTE